MGPGMMGGAWTADQPGPAHRAWWPARPRHPGLCTSWPGYTFSPSNVPIVAGETITYMVTTMGPYVHELGMWCRLDSGARSWSGPAADVAADSNSSGH